MADNDVKSYEDQMHKLKSDLEAEQAVTNFKQNEGIRTQKEQETGFKIFYPDLVKQGLISY